MFSLPVSLYLYLCLLPQRSLVVPGDAAQPVCVSCLEVQQQSWGAQVPASVRASACHRARPKLRTCACTFSEMGYKVNNTLSEMYVFHSSRQPPARERRRLQDGPSADARGPRAPRHSHLDVVALCRVHKLLGGIHLTRVPGPTVRSLGHVHIHV